MTAVQQAREALDYTARRLQADIDDGSRPDQWSMEDIVRKARAALAALDALSEPAAQPVALTDERLNIQSGLFKGKPQQWFTRSEVVALLTAAPCAAITSNGDRPPPDCNPHPDAPHGFNRNASHNAGRYVCDCEGWMPGEEAK